jgi:hypothetical protein
LTDTFSARPLNEYTNYLQKFLIRTQWTLINAREKDLYENINEDDATMIKVKIKPEKAELSRFVQLSSCKAVRALAAVYFAANY